MTIREVILRRRRVAWGGAFAGMAIILGYQLLMTEPSPVVLAIGSIPFIGAILYSHRANRCPICRENMGTLFQYGLPAKAKFCPFCGVLLDADYEKTKST